MIAFSALIWYSIFSWIIVNIFWNLLTAFKTFVLPSVSPECNFVDEYGSWAGSTEGIGKAYAKELARRKLNIVLVSRNEEKLRTVASEIEKEFKVKTKIITCDFSNGPSVYDNIETELRDISIGILVNNVGMNYARPYSTDEIPTKSLWDVINVNLVSAIVMMHVILPQMRRRKKGAIVNVSSATEIIHLPYHNLYTVSKAALTCLSHLVEYETRNSGVTVQLLSPFYVRTNINQSIRNVYQLPKFLVPDSETYARHAIQTLGFSEHTTGYWVHGIMYKLSELCPLKIRIIIAGEFTKYGAEEQKKIR